MRLALVAACLLAVVAVTISPTSGHPAPVIKDWLMGIKEKMKVLTDEQMKRSEDWVNGGFNMDFECHVIDGIDLVALSAQISTMGDAILSSVDYIQNVVEELSFLEDVSDLEDSDDDETAGDVDNVDGEVAENGGGESGEEGDEESEEKGDEEREEEGDEESGEKGNESGKTGDEDHVREEAEDGNGDDVVEVIERV